MSWSPDGRRLAFTEAPAGGNRDIMVLDTADGKVTPFIKTTFTEGGAQFSPDGRFIAYVSNESGRAEVYVQPYPGPGGKWQISTDGGSEPRWNRNGRELFYRSGDRMMAVPVSTQSTFSAGRPQMLFERQYPSTQLPQTAPHYDVSPDGQRFLFPKEAERGPGAPINVILNWPALLTRGTSSSAN
jgi:Tol biopolymer transport system component